MFSWVVDINELLPCSVCYMTAAAFHIKATAHCQMVFD